MNKMKTRPSRIRSIFSRFGIYTESDFRHIHEYEQLRTRRNGIQFSLITLDLNFEILGPASLKSLLEQLLQQLRSTDHIGWIEPNQLGLLLPGTNEVGASGFVANIEPLLRKNIGINLDDILIYPGTDNIMSAVSLATTEAETIEASEAEVASVIPFEIAE